MTDSDPSPDPAAAAEAMPFHLAEYEALRAEIRANIQALRVIRNALLVVPGVVYGALLANLDRLGLTLAAVIAWIPVFFHVVIMQFWAAESAGVRRLGRYVREIERVYAYKGLKGWETYIEETPSTIRGSRSFRRVLRLPWWTLFIAMTALAASLTLAAALGIEGWSDVTRLLAGG
jgi:hypothetical protein